MNQNETRTLWISVAAGLFAVFLLYSYSQEKKSEYDKKYGSRKRVVVAKVDIAAMQTLDDTMLDILEKPVDFIEPEAMTDPQIAVGQVAATAIKKGEQVLSTKLLIPGPDTGIALQIAPNRRAISIPTDEIRGIGKLIRPGDRIDIIAALDVGKGANQKREIKTILQKVPVLATGVNIVNNIPRLLDVETNPKDPAWVRLASDSDYSTITVEVSPEDAQKLVYILSTAPGNLFLSLRNPNDITNKRNLRVTTVESVLGKTQISQIRKTFRKPSSRLSPKISKPKKRTKKRKTRFIPL